MARKTYSDAQKNEIVKFVLAQGRGGKSAAIKKFGVSFTALQSWLGGNQARATNKKAKAGKVDGRRLRKIKTTQKAVKALQKELAKLVKLVGSL